MTIVKIISDKNCQLFIDMELVDEVLVDKMHKISLDAGSYLLEAKDANGKCMRKCKLTINSTDSQVLQNLAIGNATINKTIENLRYDPSLRFYNQRAVFYHKDSYGYINSQYKIVIAPIFFIRGKL